MIPIPGPSPLFPLYEKFSIAVSQMATSPESIHQRLYDVIRQHILPLSSTLSDAVPDYIREKYHSLVELVVTPHEQAADDEDILETTIFAMSEEEAVRLANLIVEIYEDVDEEYNSNS